MSTTLSKTGRRDEPTQQGHRPPRSTATAGPAQFSSLLDQSSCPLHNDGHGNNSPCSQRNCGSSAVSSTNAPRNCTTCKPNIDHLVSVLQLKNLYVFLNRRTIGYLHLRHDGDVDDLETRNVHHVAQSRACQRTCPRTAPEETRRSSSQFAL